MPPPLRILGVVQRRDQPPDKAQLMSIAADGRSVNVALDDTITSPIAQETDGSAVRPVIAWGAVARWAFMGVLVLTALVFVDVHRHGADHPVSMIQPGTQGPSTALFEQDFPDLELPEGVGLDGQMYYAIARDPIHLDETAEHLDHPQYRYQRPLLPVTAWLLHPSGGGIPLVASVILVSFVGIVILAMASGGLSMALRGPPWIAAIVPLLPGAYWALRVSVSDALALGLAVTALLLAARDRHAWAIAVGCLAVLAKEPAILILLGWSLSRRARKDTLLTVIPALTIAAWMGWLRLQLPADGARSQDIGPPLVGLIEAWTDVWSHGQELVGMACTVAGLVLGIVALSRRRLRHPLGWAIAIQLAFMVVMGVNPLATNFGGTRMALPLLVLSLIALATPDGATALTVRRSATPATAAA